MSAAAGVLRPEAEARVGWRLPNWRWTPLLRGSSLLAAAVALVVGALLGDPQALLTGPAGLAIGAAIIWRCYRGEERRFLLTLFVLAWSARVVGAVVSHEALMYLGKSGYALQDDRAYDKLGWALVKVWSGTYPGVLDSDQYLLVNYTYLLAILYWFIGHSLLAAKMLNVLFGGLVAVMTYALTAEIFDRRAARIAAVLAAFFPSLLAWSVINLKDILVVLLTVTAIYGGVRYARRHTWWALLLGLVAFLGLENLRQFVFFILSWLMPMAYLFADRSEQRSGWRRLVLATILGLVLIVPPGVYLYANNLRAFFLLLLPIAFVPAGLLLARDPGGRRKMLLLVPLVAGVLALSYVTNNDKLGTNFLTPKALTEAEWKRWLEESKASTGNDEFNGIKPPKDASDIVERSMTYLPRGVLYVLFGPTPWTARSGAARAVIPEMLLWYGLLAAAVAGLLSTFKTRWRDLILPLGFAAAWIVALALTEGNTGNIFRHRSQFMPFIFMMSAVGLPWFWSQYRARRAAAPRPAGLAQVAEEA